MRFLLSLTILTFAACLPISAQPAGDPDKGKKVFKKCKACHMVGPKAKKRAGPPLNDIIKAPAGAVEGFRYSKSLKAKAGEGLEWTLENLDAYLESPKKFIPKGRMSFRGLSKEKDRANVIAYLATFSKDSKQTAEVEASFTVAPEILAIEGDIEYGEYLASECKTCHQVSGKDDGIPNIVGFDIEVFVTAMHAYRSKNRENPVMRLLAGKLADDEIAALAAYFKTLEK